MYSKKVKSIAGINKVGLIHIIEMKTAIREKAMGHIEEVRQQMSMSSHS